MKPHFGGAFFSANSNFLSFRVFCLYDGNCMRFQLVVASFSTSSPLFLEVRCCNDQLKPHTKAVSQVSQAALLRVVKADIYKAYFSLLF